MQSPTFIYNNDSILIRFLTAKKYKIHRHLLLVLMISTIATNITVINISESTTIFSWITLFRSAILTIIYLSAGYFTLYVLVPRLLLKHRYRQYILLFPTVVLTAVLIDFLAEYILLTYCHILPGKCSYYDPHSILPIEIISSTLALSLGILGASFPILLGHWVISGERINELKKNTLKSELEQLKNQINPQLLFSLLDTTGTLVKKSPVEASQILIKLSKLLRYQLYDSTRSTVVLAAEISFLENFLSLKQAMHEGFTFRIRKEVNSHFIMIPPLLFIPFVEEIAKRFPDDGSYSYIHLAFEEKYNQLIFSITSTGSGYPANKITESQTLTNIERRLHLLYKGAYSLTIREKNTTCEVCLELYFQNQTKQN